jgi:hypothetical protein
VATHSRPELRLDWCSHEAAKYAVEHWHYSKSLPPPPHVRLGVWESNSFIGCVLFARGANRNLLTPFGLLNTQGAELVRVALTAHATPVSRIMSIACRMMASANPGLRLLVSFADPFQSHHGGIYQASGWVYAGQSEPSSVYIDKSGRQWHPRMVSKNGSKRVFGKMRGVVRTDQCSTEIRPGKHRYLMPLDDDMRQRIAPLARPYPKRAGSAASGTSPDQGGRGGATPTPALFECVNEGN